MSTKSLASLFAPKSTGNIIVMFERGTTKDDAARIVDAGLQSAGVATIAGFDPAATVLDNLSLAVVPGPGAGAAAAASSIFTNLPGVRFAREEYYMFSAAQSPDRLAAWMREGIHLLADSSKTAFNLPQYADETQYSFKDSAERTWGIEATGCDRSLFTGKGIKIAVLDTGFDMIDSASGAVPRHRDFLGRVIRAESFVAGSSITDMQGHGTHCVGCAAGPAQNELHPRYGVATEADILVGKVLNDRGTGNEGDILRGINWAIANKCEIVSISIQRQVSPDEGPDPLYEEVGSRALEFNTLVIAAAGNNSSRDMNYLRPVAAPANSTGILAVGALDCRMRIANFSNTSVNPAGGGIDVVGPGVSVLSSYPEPEAYKRLDGTSMATPFVAGIAALWAESDPALRGRALWKVLERTAIPARDLNLSVRDVGAGLVQAPRQSVNAESKDLTS